MTFRPTHDVGPRTPCMSGLHHAAYGLPVNASRPGSPQVHASLGSGWRPTLAGWDWFPTGFRTRFRRSPHGILSPLTGLSRHTRCCMKDLLRGTSALQIEDGASRRRTYARHSWGNADWGRTYFRLLHVFSVDGRVTDPNAWSFQAAIVDPVDDEHTALARQGVPRATPRAGAISDLSSRSLIGGEGGVGGDGGLPVVAVGDFNSRSRTMGS